MYLLFTHNVLALFIQTIWHVPTLQVLILYLCQNTILFNPTTVDTNLGTTKFHILTDFLNMYWSTLNTFNLNHLSWTPVKFLPQFGIKFYFIQLTWFMLTPARFRCSKLLSIILLCHCVSKKNIIYYEEKKIQSSMNAKESDSSLAAILGETTD